MFLSLFMAGTPATASIPFLHSGSGATESRETGTSPLVRSLLKSEASGKEGSPTLPGTLQEGEVTPTGCKLLLCLAGLV